MVFSKQEASFEVSKMIKSFWAIEDEFAQKGLQEKVIPDGYPEVIFHYGDAFKSQIEGTWSLQSKDLIAGQIRNYFYLKNTGRIGVFGIKFQPWALRALFGINMFGLTDRAEAIDAKTYALLQPVQQMAVSAEAFTSKISSIESWFLKLLSHRQTQWTQGAMATKYIIKKNGLIQLEELTQKVNISERGLERYFREYIGLSPKFYCRVIRFSYIFSLVQKENFKWTDVSYQAGFYDQSHFIKNFKEFTGEDPSKYGFFEDNMANFFLRR